MPKANGRSQVSTRDTLRHVTVDRTFVADGVRWIVDFKTGRHEGGDAEAFLDRELRRYREQLDVMRESCANSTRVRFAWHFTSRWSTPVGGSGHFPETSRNPGVLPEAARKLI